MAHSPSRRKKTTRSSVPVAAAAGDKRNAPSTPTRTKEVSSTAAQSPVRSPTRTNTISKRAKTSNGHLTPKRSEGSSSSLSKVDDITTDISASGKVNGNINLGSNEDFPPLSPSSNANKSTSKGIASNKSINAWFSRNNDTNDTLTSTKSKKKKPLAQSAPKLVGAFSTAAGFYNKASVSKYDVENPMFSFATKISDPVPPITDAFLAEQDNLEKEMSTSMNLMTRLETCVDDGDGVEEKMDSLGVRITELKNKIDLVKQVMSTVLATRNSLEDARIKAQHARNYWAEENPAEAVKWSKYCRHLNKLLAYCDDYDRQKKEALAKEAEMQREELSTGGEDSNKSPEGGA